MLTDIEALTKNAQETVRDITAGLRALMDMIESSTSIEIKNGKLCTSSKLSSEDLYAFVIRIPAECAHIQTRINEYSIAQSVQDVRTSSLVTQTVETMLGTTKGDAKERQRRAEKMNESLILNDEANRQIIKSLQSYIDRADRVYEGVKKIIDARTREWGFDRKYSGSPQA